VTRTQESLEQYEARSSAPLITLAFLFLALYAAQVLWLAAPMWALELIGGGQLLIWIIFLADFGYRVYLAPHRTRYVASHPLDVITLILPMFRPLRALRIFAAARILIDRGHHISYGKVATAIVVSALFIVLVGALVVLDLERFAPGASITTFGDALWWAAVTLTTVGYGDYYPVTFEGRASAVAMMAIGISLLGAVTATFAAWFTERVREPEEDAIEALTAQIRELRAEITGSGSPERPSEQPPTDP
jgi:voltage-gated potassium channel